MNIKSHFRSVTYIWKLSIFKLCLFNRYLFVISNQTNLSWHYSKQGHELTISRSRCCLFVGLVYVPILFPSPQSQIAHADWHLGLHIRDNPPDLPKPGTRHLYSLYKLYRLCSVQSKYITYVQNILESYDVIKRILTNRRAGIFFNVQCIVGRAEQAHHTKPLMESGPPTKNKNDLKCW